MIKTTLKFEPHDIWIGVYWRFIDRQLVVYICVLPMLPIRILWTPEHDND